MASLQDLEKTRGLLLNRKSTENCEINVDSWREHKKRKWDDYLEMTYGIRPTCGESRNCCQSVKIPLPTETTADKISPLAFDLSLLAKDFEETEKDKSSLKDFDLSRSEIQKLVQEEDRLNRLKKLNVTASIQKIEESLAAIHDALQNVKIAMDKGK
jgi:hypothetical protein